MTENKQVRKYERAWDNKLKRKVTPDEVSKAEAHDRNRYFSEQFNDDEDKGEVLTLHKDSKTYKSKLGKDVTRRRHFTSIGKNTVEYRRRTEELSNKQESIVHKLCKEVIKDIKFIKVHLFKQTL
jgi:hypothetical protein